jgi:DNA polymerase III delta prime subunit
MFKQGSIDELLKVVDNLLMDGYSPDQIVNQYFDAILNDGNMSELKKCRILEKISACEQALNEGGRDDLQLYNLFASSLSILTRPDF